jgi:hypothetical protein
MNSFPMMLYKSPGIHKKPSGGTYNYIGISTQAEFDEKISSGWFVSSADAIIAAGDNANGKDRKALKRPLKATRKPKDSKPLGWKEEAKEAKHSESEGDQDINNEPTREELEFKATELGIRFDGRTKNKKLGQLIKEKLEQKTEVENGLD